MTTEIKLKCKSCKAYNTINNPSIKATKNNKFLLSGTCSVCGKSVRSFITTKYNEHLTDDDRTNLKSGGFITPLPILATLILQKGVSENIQPEPIKEGSGFVKTDNGVDFKSKAGAEDFYQKKNNETDPDIQDGDKRRFSWL